MALPNSDTLLAIGVTLVMAGVVLRGFAANARRDLARRKQHQIDARKSTDAYMSDELARPPGWFERNLGMIANVILVAGIIVTALGFAKR
jgi:hypothetical protein